MIVQILHALAQVFNPVASFGIFAFWLILGASLFRKTPQAKYDDFVTALGYLAFCILAIQLYGAVVAIRPTTLDVQLLAADKKMHLDPHVVMAWASRHRILMESLVPSYLGLPVAIAVAWLLDQNYNLRRALVIGGLGCWIFYALVPACGPSYVINNATGWAPRNCMPSMHFAWALMLALNSRSKFAFAFWLYAGVIALATIAVGEHYFVDLIAAVPYTMAVQWVASRERPIRESEASQAGNVAPVFSSQTK